ncbi:MULTISPECIES: hypothetical protein [unclassified Pseudomonas]|uniref:hypothetical protein n=1 Tax=unclassified Pseudomonas TaxID=196821 RepID=UPI000A153DFB|nr:MULTISPECIES: hypothetical protein [unclassified Pseudomonas]
MKALRNCLFAALPFVALSGCANFEQSMQEIQKATAPVAIDQSLAEICRVTKENKVRANSLYRGKTFSTNGEVAMINQGLEAYRVVLSVGDVDIHAESTNTSMVNALSVGKKSNVSGVVTLVDYDYKNCHISLKNATF